MATKAQVKQFIEKLSKLAIAEAKKREKWILPSVCIAQGALETGWGTASIMTKANAYFGIKAPKNWKGKVYNSKTFECYDGETYTNITACFRAYESVEESVKDYFDLITGLKRYSGAVNEKDSLKCITAIKDGGYATAPEYVSSIMSIIDGYNLRQYDSEIISPKKETPSQNKKPIDVIAKEVIQGKWGNGTSRKLNLEKAGYNYSEIQNAVNILLGTPSKTPAQNKKSVEDIAREVIQGKWGNGTFRKLKLQNAGYNYSEVQKMVNKLLR